MLSFLNKAYVVFTTLLEATQRQHQEYFSCWLEMLGDLSRYRASMGFGDQTVVDLWLVTSLRWYSMAFDRSPTVGRLHSHVGTLAYHYNGLLVALSRFSRAPVYPEALQQSPKSYSEHI